jgi:hypothetical protein
MSKHDNMEACRGSGDIAPRILNLGTRWRWVVSFTLRPLCPWYHLRKGREADLLPPSSAEVKEWVEL